MGGKRRGRAWEGGGGKGGEGSPKRHSDSRGPSTLTDRSNGSLRTACIDLVARSPKNILLCGFIERIK